MCQDTLYKILPLFATQPPHKSFTRPAPTTINKSSIKGIINHQFFINSSSDFFIIRVCNCTNIIRF